MAYLSFEHSIPDSEELRLTVDTVASLFQSVVDLILVVLLFNCRTRNFIKLRSRSHWALCRHPRPEKDTQDRTKEMLLVQLASCLMVLILAGQAQAHDQIGTQLG